MFYLFYFCLLVNLLLHDNVCCFKIYVAELPADMETPRDWHLTEDPDYLIGPRISKEDSLFDSDWQHMDKWWIYQVLNSPLRVKTAKEADIVFIPVSCTIIHAQHDHLLNVSYILGNGTKYFPYLYEKPHVIVINHPQSQGNYGRTFQHDMRHWYHVITISADFGSLRNMNTTIAPHFWRVHWQNDSKEFHEAYNETTIVQQKQYLATGCWKGRDKHLEDGFYISRRAWKEQCLNYAKECKWIDWDTNPAGKSLYQVTQEIKQAIDASWYTIIPIGDYHTRGSVFDMLVSDSIGVLESRVEEALPFLDFIQYKEMLMFVEPGGKIIDNLRSEFTQEKAMQMIKKKFAVKHLFQYSLQPNHSLVSAQARNTIHPDDDAFTFTLKTMLRRWCKEGFYKLLNC